MADPRNDETLTAPGGPAGVSSGAPVPAAPEGTPLLPFRGRIGPFDLVRVLGQGGMGTVYLAEQREPVRRSVALKLMRAALSTPADLARFEGEREALARLTHPAIAQMYEAGTADGAPWFAMEYVEGEPLTAYCDARSLPLGGRLELLAAVCRGVQFAHQKGIIHRDLKPGNVLVAETDGTPHVKIIDFGLAKAIDAPLSGATLMTPNHLMGTPGYMSPEAFAVGPHGVDIDTRSDVYALGVMLYELVAGMRPFDVDRMPLPAVFRLVSTEDAPQPSKRFRSVDSAVREEIAAARGLRARDLLSALSGDLNWIVARATARDREERYDSAAALADDLERTVRHEPITARPPSAAYRARKFVRRHRVEVAAAAAIGVACVAGLVGILRESVRARRAEERANAVAGFLKNTLESADPYRSNPSDFRVRDMLDQAVPRLSTELAGRPDVRAELLETIGSVYMHLGVDAKAEAAFREVAHYAAVRFGADSIEAAAANHDLALAMPPAKRKEAEALLRRVVEIRRRVRGEEHGSVARALLDLSSLVDDVGERESLLRRSMAIREKEAATDPGALAFALNGLGWFLINRGRLTEAEPYVRRALEIRRRASPEGQTTQRSLLATGTLLNRMERFAEAERALREGLPIAEKIRGKDDVQVAEMAGELGIALRGQGRLAESEPFLERSRDILLGGGSPRPEAASALAELGILRRRQGRLDEASALLARAISLAAAAADPEGASMALVESARADVLFDSGDRSAAEEAYRRALAIEEKIYPPDALRTRRTREAYARLLRADGRAGAAADQEAQARAADAK